MGRAQKLKKQRKVERIEIEEKKKKRNRLMIKFLSIGILTALFGWIVFSAGVLIKKKYFPKKETVATQSEIKENKYSKAPDMTIDLNKTYIAKFETNQGNFEVTLNAKEAPKTVNNFVFLARDKFYDGLTFHRIVKDFMIQGGDPKGDGTSGPGYTIPAEIKLKHTAGAIATARLGDEANPNKDSSGSQFFIDLKDQPSLDQGGYTVFGYVTNGMDVVEKLGVVKTSDNGQGEQSKPDEKQTINKVTIEEK